MLQLNLVPLIANLRELWINAKLTIKDLLPPIELNWKFFSLYKLDSLFPVEKSI